MKMSTQDILENSQLMENKNLEFHVSDIAMATGVQLRRFLVNHCGYWPCINPNHLP